VIHEAPDDLRQRVVTPIVDRGPDDDVGGFGVAMQEGEDPAITTW